MRAEGKDLKQQEQVLQETETMLPDCESRILTALSELNQLMSESDDALKATELYQEITTYLNGR